MSSRNALAARLLDDSHDRIKRLGAEDRRVDSYLALSLAGRLQQ